MGIRIESVGLCRSIFCELAGSVIFGIIAGSLSAIAMSESMTNQEIKASNASPFSCASSLPSPRSLERPCLSLQSALRVD